MGEKTLTCAEGSKGYANTHQNVSNDEASESLHEYVDFIEFFCYSVKA